MREWKLNDEQRIAISLSDFAHAVIDQDKWEFRSRSRSDFVCRVFGNFYQEAHASIGRTLRREEGNLRSAIEWKPSQQEALQSVVGLLMERRRAQLIHAHTRYPRSGTAENIRLQNGTVSILLSCHGFEGGYYPGMGAYVKAVVEEYCRLPYIRRERVYFKEAFQTIAGAIQGKRQLELTVQDGRTFFVHPCRMMTDRLDSANYLAGFSRYPGDGVSQKVPASFRIASLAGVRALDDPSFVSERSLARLNQLIAVRGVQFLLNEETVVRVRLTPAGQYKLGRMAALRPRCTQQQGQIYTFHCTQLQAEYYFVGMGADCEVLEPPSLRARMAGIHADALKLYGGQ